MSRPALWWLDATADERPPFELEKLGSNLVDLRAHLESGLAPDERARTQAAIDWHLQALAVWAFGQYQARAGLRDLPFVPVPRPASAAVWVDALGEDGRGQS